MRLEAVFIPAIALVQLTSIAHSETRLSADDIVNALQGDKPQLTRSLTAKPANTAKLSNEDRKFFTEVSTRGLRVEKIAKAGEIIDKNDLPSLDIEIVFEFDSSKISAQSSDELEALGNALRNEALAGTQILLNGHTDAKGEKDYNLELSQKRAEAVRSRLISEYGISPDRLVAIGFGEERLKKPEEPDSGINRRVEIINIGESQ